MKYIFQKFLFIIAFLFSYTSVSAECEIAFQTQADDIFRQTKGSRFIEWTRDISGAFAATFAGRIITVVEGIVVVEFFDSLGKLERDEISDDNLNSIKASTLAKKQFELIENNPLKKIDSFNIPKTHKEQKLREQGLENELIAGMDVAHYLKALGQALVRSKINPFRTHIKDIARQIPSYFQHIRKGIELQQNEHTEKKLAILDALEKEAQSKVDNESVTYAWWLSVNERLSILVSPFEGKIDPKEFSEQNYKVSTEIIEVLQLFPELIILPTIHGQSTFSLNRFSFQGVAPAELANHEKTADGDSHTPRQLFAHDLRHAIIGFGRKPKQQEVAAFHDQLMIDVESLEPKVRKPTEKVYWILTHESESNERIELSHFTNRKNIQELITRGGEFNNRFAKHDDMGYLLPGIDYRLRYVFDSIEIELSNMIKVFHRVAVKTAKTMKQDSN